MRDVGVVRAAPDRRRVQRSDRSRKRFTNDYKLRILRDVDACSCAGELVELLRRERLFSSQLSLWRLQQDEGTLRARSATPAVAPVRVTRPLSAPKRALDESAIELGRGRGSSRYTLALWTVRERVILGLLTLIWAGSTAWFTHWWLLGSHWGTVLGMIAISALLTFDFVLLPVWILFFVWRSRVPNPLLPAPELRVAMIVTKAPSEPWPIVRRTLEAMLEQDYPDPYGVWLADEDPSPSTEHWCRKHGVRISTRRGRAAYNRPTWPRRARTKEGNLAYFYDRWGYREYDVVAQFDADHVPDPDYLRHIVAPFIDKSVGYVAAPSVCDQNANPCWASRGRLFTEALMNGALQAGATGHYPPHIIGSHYAVRTVALRQIGGIGPELAEDFSTTLIMVANGWRGAFALDAEAHGEGPNSFEDYVRQEVQWARSMMTILLRFTKPYWRTIPGRAKLVLGARLAWYPLYSLVGLASVLLPAVALLTHAPPARVAVGGFFAHLLLPMASISVTVIWVRLRGALRPRRAKVMSWEGMLYPLVKWPWGLIGCGQALLSRVSRKESTWKVTPKARQTLRHMPILVVLPFVVLSLGSALTAVLETHPGAASGYYFWCLLNAAVYGLLALMICMAHVLESARGMRLAVARRALPAVAVALIATVSTAGACVLRGKTAVRGLSFGVNSVMLATPWPINAGPQVRVELGVVTDALARNWWTPFGNVGLNEVTAFEHQVRKHVGIVEWFADWAHSKVNVAQLEAVAARGSTPEITWEPWNARRGTYGGAQPQYTLASIIDGRHDAYIWSWARGIAKFGGPVLIRFAQEMNLTAYPWSERDNGNRPGQYASAWRHVHDIFRAAGATNALWVWAPVARPFDPRDYPGPSYVNILGLSGFNGGGSLHWGGWHTFSKIYNKPLEALHRLDPTKPIQITEVSSSPAGGNKAQWITDMFQDLRRFPEVKSVVWFNLVKEADWLVDSSPAALHAFVAAVAAPRYGDLGFAPASPALANPLLTPGDAPQVRPWIEFPSQLLGAAL